MSAKKLNLKDKYRLLTRDLDWDFSYEDRKDAFPFEEFEGIKISANLMLATIAAVVFKTPSISALATLLIAQCPPISDLALIFIQASTADDQSDNYGKEKSAQYIHRYSAFRLSCISEKFTGVRVDY